MADGDAPTDAGAVAVEEHRRQLEELEGSVDDLEERQAVRRVLGLLEDVPADGRERIRKFTTRGRLRHRRLPTRIRGCSRSTSSSRSG